MAQSLFKACKNLSEIGESGTQTVGSNSVIFEYYTQSSIDKRVTFGDSNQNKVVLIVDDTITIPSGYTLTPSNPKKSLVIFCNTFTNNGTVSMTGKGPNIQPHQYLLYGKDDGYSSDIIIPAYANNYTATYLSTTSSKNGIKGKDGTSRNCGAGGMGGCIPEHYVNKARFHRNGGGTAFGGGAGSGGIRYSGWEDNICPYYSDAEVSTTYPMRAGSGKLQEGYTSTEAQGGVGTPCGTTSYANSNSGVIYTGTNQNSGVGGRIIIFCNTFTNNGTIVTNGTGPKTSGTFRTIAAYGGASGAGAIDVFYKNLIRQGTTTATGGKIGSFQSGGNGSVTLLQWTEKRLVQNKYKNLSDANLVYLFNEYADRLL